MFGLFAKILSMRFPWNVWVMILALVNGLGGIYFFQSLEGKITLISIIGAGILMQIIFSKMGFVRLLGIAHIIFWVPLVLWLSWRLQSWDQLSRDLRIWMLVVVILNSFSLLIDFFDVWRYIRGDKYPI